MLHFPKWNWLFSGLSMQRPRQRVAVRPCLAAVELLDDRVLLSATTHAAAEVAPQPASNQAVETLLKWEGDFIKLQDGILGTELKLLKHSANPISQSTAAYFLKLDSDLANISGDLIGQQAQGGTNVAAAANPVGGIDGVLITDYLKFSDLASKDAFKIQSNLTRMATVDSALNKITTDSGGVSRDAVDAYLKLEYLKYKEQIAASSLNAAFIKLEEAFVGTDLATPVNSLASDVAAIPTDAAPQNPPAFDAFLKFEEGFIKQQDGILKFETDQLKAHKITSSSPSTAYFLKIDADFLKIDVDLAGNPPTTNNAAAEVGGSNGGGLNGVLQGGNLPADVIAEISNKWSPAIYKAEAFLKAEITALQPPAINSVAAAASQKFEGQNSFLKWKIAEESSQLRDSFLKFEVDFLAGTPDRPLVDALLTDLNTLAADAGNNKHAGDNKSEQSDA
ncbi:MAG TPA: hypothetical protein VGH74_11985 [Planctomycetaceae bacterium]